MFCSDHNELLDEMAQMLGARLQSHAAILRCAESCTGGCLSGALTEVPGASAWFDRGYVVYANAAKQELLGVPLATLQEHGAVSEACARAMALGALADPSLPCATIAVTGVAGPDGGTPDKPVGLVWLAWAWRLKDSPARVEAQRFVFSGNRSQVRQASVAAAMRGLLERLPVAAGTAFV